MSHSESIKQQAPHNSNPYQNYLIKLHKIEQDNLPYRSKIIQLICSQLPHSICKQEQTLNSFNLQFGQTNTYYLDHSARSFDSSQRLGGLSSFYDKYMMLGTQSATNHQNRRPTEEELCQILQVIKERNRKTSIQLMIKILHEIICSKQAHSSSVAQDDSQNQTSIGKNLIENRILQERFRNYEIRFNYYKERIKKNYMPASKQQGLASEVKQQESECPPNSVTKFIHERFIQFSVPYNVVQYFKYKNSLPFRRYLDRQPFSERRLFFKEFLLKGHTLASYNLERKTAKLFCLVGPGVRAARPFMGQDLGSHSHSKTISNIVKNGYRALQQYVNDRLHCFLKPTDTSNVSPLPSSFGAQGVEYPCYYASRRQLSGIKTPLFNCRNWMDEDELQLFLIFIRKSYRIKYPVEWQEEKVNKIFLLFGRIIKKLMEKDILIRNLQVLKGQDLVPITDTRIPIADARIPNANTRIPIADIRQLSEKTSQSGIRKTPQKIRQKYGIRDKQEKVKGKMNEYSQNKLGKKQLFEKKYKKYANIFRSNDQSSKSND